MKTTDYQPIACGLHSEYELLAMRRARRSILYLDEAGEQRQLEGNIVDVQTRHGAEYMTVEARGERLDIRLDRILSV